MPGPHCPGRFTQRIQELQMRDGEPKRAPCRWRHCSISRTRSLRSRCKGRPAAVTAGSKLGAYEGKTRSHAGDLQPSVTAWRCSQWARAHQADYRVAYLVRVTQLACLHPPQPQRLIQRARVQLRASIRISLAPSTLRWRLEKRRCTDTTTQDDGAVSSGDHQLSIS